MGAIELIALSMGVAWASGINLYATLAMLGIMGATGNIDLPPDLEILTNPIVIFAACGMYVVEFFADKIPGVDTVWDTLHTFVRIPAGAIMAAGALGDVSPAAEMAALILGGGLAGVSHGVKAGSRVLINTSPEPFTNWTASVAEDVAVIGGLWTALNHPVAFLVVLGIFILLAIWLLPKLWRAIKFLFAKLRQLFGGPKAEMPATSTSEAFQPGLLPDGQNPSDSENQK